MISFNQDKTNLKNWKSATKIKIFASNCRSLLKIASSGDHCQISSTVAESADKLLKKSWIISGILLNKNLFLWIINVKYTTWCY